MVSLTAREKFVATKHGHVSYDLLDDNGNTNSQIIYCRLDDTQTIATALTEAGLLAQNIDPITDSQITGIHLSVDAAIPGGMKSSPAATAENNRTAVFNLSQSSTPYKFPVEVLSFADALLVGGRVDLSDADVLAFIAGLTAAGTALTPESTSFYTLVALIDALLSFRKRYKTSKTKVTP